MDLCSLWVALMYQTSVKGFLFRTMFADMAETPEKPCKWRLSTNRQKYTGRLRVRRVFALAIVFFSHLTCWGNFVFCRFGRIRNLEQLEFRLKHPTTKKNAIAKSFVCFPTWVFEKSRIEVSQVFSLVAFFLLFFVVSLKKHQFSLQRRNL